MSAVQQRLQQDQPQPFLTAMSGAVTQVSVVTTNGTAGRFGVTVSAFTSVSADPPLVLVCINRRSPVVKAIEDNGCFCVNLLDDRQSTVADCFSGRSDPLTAYDFSCANWRLEATGSPCLDQANANFDCTIENAYDAGTHRNLLARCRMHRRPVARLSLFPGAVIKPLAPSIWSNKR